MLADCLACAVEQGAERLVDLATLTGAIVIALGSTYAGLFAQRRRAGPTQVERGGRARGRAVWRLPLHAEYAELIKGRYADIANAVEARKAGSITAAEFLAASSATCRGRTSTSPARPGTSAALRGQGRLGLRRAPAGRARAR